MQDEELEDRISIERSHIRQGELLVARQEAIVERLATQKDAAVMAMARTLLLALESSLRLARERLEHLEHQRHATR